MAWQNSAEKIGPEGSQHGKDSESLEKSGEVSVFLLLTIREWASFEPFGSDNWTWTSLQGLKAAL